MRTTRKRSRPQFFVAGHASYKQCGDFSSLTCLNCKSKCAAEYCSECHSLRNTDQFFINKQMVRVYWPKMEEWYTGVVCNVRMQKCGHIAHRIKYDDGDAQWHVLVKETFTLATSDPVEVKSAHRTNTLDTKTDASLCDGDSRATKLTVHCNEEFVDDQESEQSQRDFDDSTESSPVLVNNFMKLLKANEVSEGKAAEISTYFDKEHVSSSQRRSLIANLKTNKRLAQRVEITPCSDISKWTSDDMKTPDRIKARQESRKRHWKWHITHDERDADVPFASQQDVPSIAVAVMPPPIASPPVSVVSPPLATPQDVPSIAVSVVPPPLASPPGLLTSSFTAQYDMNDELLIFLLQSPVELWYLNNEAEYMERVLRDFADKGFDRIRLRRTALFAYEMLTRQCNVTIIFMDRLHRDPDYFHSLTNRKFLDMELSRLSRLGCPSYALHSAVCRAYRQFKFNWRSEIR